MKPFVVLITTPNRKVSERLSKDLVGKKLAACVNRVPNISSRYWWEGKVQTAQEELLIAKTHQGRLKALIQWVGDHHPYQVCEVLALPVAAGHRPYLDWIKKSLGTVQKNKGR